MDFRTEIIVKNSLLKISPADLLLTMGSCFSQSIGQKLIKNKFQASVNPFGTTYHPLAIHKLLQYSVQLEVPSDHTFLENNRIHFNYDFHSGLSSTNRDELKNELREKIISTNHFIKTGKVIILTYGTSWMYERADTGEAVANCHKMPSTLFTKRLTSQEEIVKSFEGIFKILKTINPTLKVILTVSPVRHLKDSIVLNNVSKSILNIACHTLASENPDVEYFPAFEIMMDDLRDYRFYKDDLIHPTDAAIEYIWEKFSFSYFDKKTQEFLNQWSEISKALAHRPFQPAGESHQKFLKATLKQLEELKSLVNVEKEIVLLKSQLN